MPKEDEEPSESSPKRQRREEPVAEVASESASSQQPETQSDGKDVNKKEASSASSSHPEVQLQTPKVFIGGLHRNVTETHVEKLMMPYGSIVRVNLVLQPGSAASKGFAFCEYATIEQAAAAVAALDGRALLGRRLQVRPAYEKDRPTTIGMASTGGTNKVVSKEKEQRNLETKIQALKRKIQEKQAQGR
jgi:RNA recognition motif-containing protein